MTAPTERSAKRINPRNLTDDDDASVSPVSPHDIEPDDDDDDAAVARVSRRSRPATRAARDADGEDAPPWKAPKRSAVREDDVEPDGEDTVVVQVARGRKAIKRSRPDAGNALWFKWPEDAGEEQVIKFLDEDPWSYNQHWVERGGKKSFPCIGSGCPLCEIGAKTGQKIVYSILNLSHPDGPTVQTLEVTPTVDDDLVALDQGKSGPLPRQFWSASRPKKAKAVGFAKYNYIFAAVKERDLHEDYAIDLTLVDDALAKAEAPDPSKVLGNITRSELQNIADEAMSQ